MKINPKYPEAPIYERKQITRINEVTYIHIHYSPSTIPSGIVFGLTLHKARFIRLITTAAKDIVISK
jgi:hypothetical protein